MVKVPAWAGVGWVGARNNSPLPPVPAMEAVPTRRMRPLLRALRQPQPPAAPSPSMCTPPRQRIGVVLPPKMRAKYFTCEDAEALEALGEVVWHDPADLSADAVCATLQCCDIAVGTE